jgi:hypothetical protein
MKIFEENGLNKYWKRKGLTVEISCEEMPEFIRMMKVLHSQETNKKSTGYKFRENMLKEQTDLYVFLTPIKDQFNKYAYMVEVYDCGMYDHWKHEDGIMQEKDELKKNGVKEHPVLNIVSLTDIYNASVK